MDKPEDHEFECGCFLRHFVDRTGENHMLIQPCKSYDLRSWAGDVCSVVQFALEAADEHDTPVDIIQR